MTKPKTGQSKSPPSEETEAIQIRRDSRLGKKARFIRAVAEYLAGNQAGKSIALEIESGGGGPMKWASEWAKVRGESGLFGYPTREEAEAQLWELLG
jgi:hypothetical protein